MSDPERIIAKTDYDGEVDGQWIDASHPKPHSFGGYFTEYVRADLFDALRAEVERLTRERDTLNAFLLCERAKWDAADARADAAEADAAAARALLQSWLDLHDHCAIEAGVCCCGESMADHSGPMSAGHTPADLGSYQAGLLAARTRAAPAQGGEGDGGR